MPREEPKIIAVNLSIRELDRLRRYYGGHRWRKIKGKANVIDEYGMVIFAEIHWYECHGIGRREAKIARELK
jgi:hypothetical protein